MAVVLSDLKQLLGTPDVDDSAVQLFATQGELVVAQQLADTDLADAVKDLIALYLAAHFAVLANESGGIKIKKIGMSEDHYRGVAADKVGYLQTRFGQQAIAFDTSGTLVAMSQQWAGRAVVETIRRDDCE